MEEKRKKQIMQAVDQAYRSWAEKDVPESQEDGINKAIQFISQNMALGVIIVSGKNNPSAYIGTYRQCKDLKEQFSGQMAPIDNNWYWIGNAASKNIESTVKNFRKNLIITILPKDMEETVLNVAEAASFDIKYGEKTGGTAAYIGNYRVCTLLKAKYKGKIGKSYNHWYWIGKASFQEITKLYKAYQSRSKRFRRKRVVLQNYA